MSNKLEKFEIQFQPEQEFTLKIPKNKIIDLENNIQNNSSGVGKNKYNFNNNINDNLQNNDINNIYNYNFSNLNDKLKKYYTLNNNNNTDFFKVNLNNNNKEKRKEKENKNTKPNNIHIYSKMSDYWEKRERKNRKKMEKIKKERENKLYGNIYQKPKINKNSEDIINRIKENLNNQISEEEQIEDQINRNIPVKTEQTKLYFKNYKNNDKKTNNKANENYYTNTVSQKLNKNNSLIDPKDSYVRLMKLKKYHKRTKTPKPKNINSLIRKKIPNKYNKADKKLNINEIKSLEKIGRLRNEEEKERFKKLQIKINKENNEHKKDFNIKIINEEKTNKQLININRSNHLNPQKGISIDSLNKNIKFISEKIKKRRNKIQNSLSLNDKYNLSLQLNNARQQNTMSEMMKQRKYLNDIYNIDKRIINHSYIQASKNKNSQNNVNTSKKINSMQNSIYSFPKLSKLNNYLSQKNNKNRKINNKRKINLYDEKSKNMKYKHFTEIKIFPDSTINSNNSLKYYNLIKNRMVLNNKNKFELNKNCESNINNKEKYKSINYLNNIYMNNSFNKSINEGINNNFVYEQSQNYNNIINKYDKEYPKYNLNNERYNNIILQNESINKIFKEIDNESLESLLKFRKENEKNLIELNKNKHKFNKRFLDSNLINQIEESKNYNPMDENLSRTLNNQKVKNILINEKEKIENNLDYYNKELILNKKKKEMILGEIYGKKFNQNNNNINKRNNEIQWDNNIYKYNYSQREINKSQNQDFFENEIYDNIIGNFNFQRKHKF